MHIVPEGSPKSVRWLVIFVFVLFVIAKPIPGAVALAVVGLMVWRGYLTW